MTPADVSDGAVRNRCAGRSTHDLFCAGQGGMEWRDAVRMLDLLPLEVVSQLMGHDSPHVTAQRYLSLRLGWLDQTRTASQALTS